MKIKCLFLTALLLTVTSTGSAQSKSGATPVKGIIKLVALSKTKPCVVLEGSVQPKNFDTYILKCGKDKPLLPVHIITERKPTDRQTTSRACRVSSS